MPDPQFSTGKGFPMPNNRIVRVDHKLKCISIEFGDRQRIYVPRTASMKRLQGVLRADRWNKYSASKLPLSGGLEQGTSAVMTKRERLAELTRIIEKICDGDQVAKDESYLRDKVTVETIIGVTATLQPKRGGSKAVQL